MTHIVDLLFLAYFVAYNGVNTLLMAISVLQVVHKKASRMPEFDISVMAEDSTPSISFIAPAYNESANIVDSIRAFLQIEYSNLQIIVVNDGSTDKTLEILQQEFRLSPVDLVVRQEVKTRPVRGIFQSLVDPRVLVVDKENGGKADALNVGLNVSRTPLVCCVDSDTLVDSKALLRLVEPMVYDNAFVASVGGTVRVANGCEVKDGVVRKFGLPSSWLARFQVIEYLRSFLFGRLGFNALGGNLIISGAFGLFNRQAILAAGGYTSDTVGEDMELVIRLHRRLREQGLPYKVVQIPEPVCYTEVPESVSILSRQRDRWQRGLLESLWRHRGVFFNPKYRGVGLFVFPVFLLFELFGPLIELAGYLWFGLTLLTGVANPQFAVLFTFIAFFWGFLLSMQSLILDDLNTNIYRGVRVRLALMLVALLENFGYRQMTLYFRLKGLFKYLAGERAWGKMQRRGFRTHGGVL